MGRTPSLAVLVAASLPLGIALGAGGCQRSPRIGLAIDVPSDAKDQATWFEVGAFTDASCAALRPILAGGVPSGARKRLAFPADGRSPDVGDLPRATYAFAAVAKDAECGIIASGCVESDVSDAKDVTVVLDAVDPPSGTCGVGARCVAARCVPEQDDFDPNAGGGCSLELVGAGPLASPFPGAGARVSAPAVAPSEHGFVVVYREVEIGASSARLTLLPIDEGGGAGTALRPLLGGRCADVDETDGLGLLVDGESGRVILARPACGARPGLELLGFATRPAIELTEDFRSSDSPAARGLLLSAGHVAANRTSGDIVAFTEDGAPRVATVIDAQGVVAPSGSFGGGGQTGAWAAASDGLLALLSAGSAGLRLFVAPASTALTAFDATAASYPSPPVSVPGAWGAVAASKSRAIVVSHVDGRDGVELHTMDLGASNPVDADGFALKRSGVPVTAADITANGDRFFVGVLGRGQVELHAYEGARSTPAPLRAITFSDDTRLAGSSVVRDGRVAVAASPTRIALVWTTATVLKEGEPAGGYALFACTR